MRVLVDADGVGPSTCKLANRGMVSTTAIPLFWSRFRILPPFGLHPFLDLRQLRASEPRCPGCRIMSVHRLFPKHLSLPLFLLPSLLLLPSVYSTILLLSMCASTTRWLVLSSVVWVSRNFQSLLINFAFDDIYEPLVRITNYSVPFSSFDNPTINPVELGISSHQHKPNHVIRVSCVS
jgi:hypothetical protein